VRARAAACGPRAERTVFDAHTRKRTKDAAAAPAPAAPIASVFQFATTVERGAWQDGAARRELQVRLRARTWIACLRDARTGSRCSPCRSQARR
jgi:hypothetical protein